MGKWLAFTNSSVKIEICNSQRDFSSQIMVTTREVLLKIRLSGVKISHSTAYSVKIKTKSNSIFDKLHCLKNSKIYLVYTTISKGYVILCFHITKLTKMYRML